MNRQSRLPRLENGIERVTLTKYPGYFISETGQIFHQNKNFCSKIGQQIIEQFSDGQENNQEKESAYKIVPQFILNNYRYVRIDGKLVNVRKQVGRTFCDKQKQDDCQLCSACCQKMKQISLKREFISRGLQYTSKDGDKLNVNRDNVILKNTQRSNEAE